LQDPVTGRLLSSLERRPQPAAAFAFAPDGKTLAVGDSPGPVKIWDTATKKVRAGFDVPGGAEIDVVSLAFSPDGKTLALAYSDGTIRLWGIHNQQVQPPVVLRGHADAVLGLVFSPDGKTLATGSLDKTVKLWNLVARQEVATFLYPENCWGVAFSPDGQFLAAGVGNEVRLLHAPPLAEADGKPALKKE
jgi:WD40 repeat protein